MAAGELGCQRHRGVADPKTDPDVGDFFRRLAESEFLPTWYAQREAGALGSQEQAAASKAAVHAETPTVAHADSLGRPFLTVAHNKFKYSDTPPADPPPEELHRTRVILDIEGNQREVIDAKDRVVMRYDYDLLGNRIHQASMEAGERWMLNDVAGKPLYAWDSRNHQFHTAYDPLRRPTDSFLQEGAGAELLVRRTVYGETRPNPEASNLRGKVVQLFDQAGVVTSDEYDFKGNLLRSQRQLAQAYKTTLNWPTVPLEADIYTSRTRYDALNRPTELTTPHTPAIQPSVIRPGYNEANLLERVEASLRGAAVATPFVTDIDYDAKGQRTLIDYGNGVRTTYEYDPLTFRLAHLTTLRGQERLQDLSYIYDPAGNITSIRDDARQTIYFNGQVVEPHCDYVYDALYRLIDAKGREHIGQIGRPETTWNDEFRVNLQHPHDGQAMRNYTERYVYDAVGNFEELIHQAANGNWTRTYTYTEPSLIEPGKISNRLSSTIVHPNGNQPIVEPYTHDAHGNMTSMPHLSKMEWDFQDQLQATSKQVVNNGGTPETTYYVYDAAGQRVRKVTDLATGQVKDERVYLGGFEIYRRHGADALVRETLHIMDDKQRVALVETRTEGEDGSPEQLIRYQFGNHLGSASLELDDAGRIISYEEYYPYGSTSFQAGRSGAEVSLKRYRYTGMERDEESGLSYHAARYYAPWLARWMNCDPAGFMEGFNLYTYVGGNPIAKRDLLGLNGKDPNEEYVWKEGETVVSDEGIVAVWSEGAFQTYETIEITGTPPASSSPLDIAIRNGISQFITREELQRQETFEYERQPGALTREERAEYYRQLPDQEDKYYEGLQERYNALWNAKEVELQKNYRRIDAAAGVINVLGVVTVVVAAGLVLGPGLIALKSSPGAYALGASIYSSAPKVLVGTIAYGVLAPPGAPDLPGPGNEVGQLLKPAVGKVVKTLGQRAEEFLPQAIKSSQASKAKYGEQGLVMMARKSDIKQIDEIVKKFNLTKDQRRIFHDEITGQDLSLEELWQIAADIAANQPKGNR